MQQNNDISSSSSSSESESDEEFEEVIKNKIIQAVRE
jgi:hypothetical protein